MSDRTDDELAAVAARHLRALAAAPRFTGSPAAEGARRYCARELGTLGFEVREEPFEYSRFVGCYATPVAGAWSALSIGVSVWFALREDARLSLAVIVLALAALGVFALVATRRGVLGFPWLRARGVNLIACHSERSEESAFEESAFAERPEQIPRVARNDSVWLVAHVDSKSQTVPMLVRVASVALLIVSWIALVAIGVMDTMTHVAGSAWIGVGAAGVLASMGVMATLVGNASSGAIDNASGMVTVLLAASLLPRDANVGVIITDAEELGLAGARAMVGAGTLTPSVALNVDGVDDDGDLLVMTHGARSVDVVRALQRAHASASSGTPVSLDVRRLIPGILVDSLAFADAGWRSATLSRGTARTLRRIHTSADGLEHLRGVGIPLAARVLAGAALERI